MCRGFVPHHKSILKKTDVVLLSPEVYKDDSVKTFRTETSSLSSYDESSRGEKKSCLKVKTQSDSLSTKGLFSLTTQEDKSVYFSTIDIHTHALALGDAVPSGGPALTIAWESDYTTSFAVDEYEDLRGENVRKRDELRVPAYIRKEWLQKEGYTLKEIMKAQAKALQVARGRMESVRDSVEFEQKKELVKRKFQKWVLHPLSPTDKKHQLLQEWSSMNTTTNKIISCST